MLSERQLRFLLARRVAHLATVDATGRPHLVPVCFAVGGGSAYVAIDAKPKRAAPRTLKRLRNIAANPRVALTADRWDEDWSRLGWVMIQGVAEILDDGDEHDRAHVLLRARYAQYREMALAELPVIALRIEHVVEWQASPG